MTGMSHQDPGLEPGTATAESGQVLLDGPNGIAAAMTPDAAEETGRRLIAAAEQARAQRGTNAAD